MPFYAVANGRNVGIFNTWEDCYKSVNGYKNAVYKKFDNIQQAEDFIESNAAIFDDPVDNFTPDYYVYTDGACSNNGKLNAEAGIGIYFGENDVRKDRKSVV